MAQVVGAKLAFKPVSSLGEGGSHDPGVGNDDVERLACRVQGVGTGSDAGERGEVKLDQIEAPAAFGCCLAYGGGGSLGLGKIARCPDDMRAMRYQRACGFDAKPGRNTCDQHPLAAEIDAVQHFVRG